TSVNRHSFDEAPVVPSDAAERGLIRADLCGECSGLRCAESKRAGDRKRQREPFHAASVPFLAPGLPVPKTKLIAVALAAAAPVAAGAAAVAAVPASTPGAIRERSSSNCRGGSSTTGRQARSRRPAARAATCAQTPPASPRTRAARARRRSRVPKTP